MFFISYSLAYDRIFCRHNNSRDLSNRHSQSHQITNNPPTEPATQTGRLRTGFFYSYYTFCHVTDAILKKLHYHQSSETEASCENISETLKTFMANNQLLFAFSKEHSVYSEFVLYIKKAVEEKNLTNSPFFEYWNVFNSQEQHLLELYKTYKSSTYLSEETDLNQTFARKLTIALANAEILFQSFKYAGRNSGILIALDGWIEGRIERWLLDFYENTERNTDYRNLKSKSDERREMVYKNHF
ncbi:hypothetical protein CDIK_4092 [Cucumispora dikerogammari]|nr:hypothetical protein CDIK_4092 [Cucumispora dikerogammari]